MLHIIDHHALKAFNSTQSQKAGPCMILQRFSLTRRHSSTSELKCSLCNLECGDSITLRVGELVHKDSEILGRDLGSVELEQQKVCLNMDLTASGKKPKFRRERGATDRRSNK